MPIKSREKIREVVNEWGVVLKLKPDAVLSKCKDKNCAFCKRQKKLLKKNKNKKLKRRPRR